MSNEQDIDIPINTAIVAVVAIAMVVITFTKGFTVKTRSGDEFDCKQDKGTKENV